MKLKSIIFALLATAAALGAQAQESSSSTATMTRGTRQRHGQQQTGPAVSSRLQQHLDKRTDDERPDASVKFMRVVYRELDLQREDRNAPLYFPEDLVDGQENLFRIMFRLLAENKIPAYEFLDGREDFSENNRVKMSDIISRFSIYATPAKGSTDKNPVYEINPVDVPTNEVLAYYIIERWTFDNRTNAMKTEVEAICPVMVQDDMGFLAGKTPMFWMKMSDLMPYLQEHYVFVDDENNLPTHTYADYFTLNMYKGDIYKTRNLRNKTLAMMANDDPEDLKRMQDSIQHRLEHYADNLWVPTREELAEKRRVADSIAAANDTTGVVEAPKTPRSTRNKSTRTSRVRQTKSTAKAPKKEKATAAPKPKATSSSAARSVRNRRR